MKVRITCRVELELDAQNFAEAEERALLMISSGIHTENESVIQIVPYKIEVIEE